jgi:hypothetical protein
MGCCPNDFMFPMLADVYYPTVSQGAYGNVVKAWTLNKTVSGNFTPAGSEIKEELTVNVDLTIDSILIGRVKEDIRISTNKKGTSITNIIVTNIRDAENNQIFVETAGPRAGQATIFEIATQQPFVNPFGKIEHYRVILRRSENQAVTV